MTETTPLTPTQTHALFDVLIHHQLYTEIAAFKEPSTINTYGYPFRKDDGVQTTSPLLQIMVNKLLLHLPGLKNVNRDFWTDKVQVLMQKAAEAELSQSYDKGAIGARKALATACSAMLEYVVRGMLGGWPKGNAKEKKEKKEYDVEKAEDVLRAWDDAVQEVIYGDLLDRVCEKIAETPKLEDHESIVRGAHEYMMLNLASLLHHVFVMSPDGQYILRIIENVHRLIPYGVVKQTLRVGNAATMINGMVKLVLTKLSVTAVTNWLGLTNNSNDGMNLMQQIISTVMAWDTTEFQRRAQKLESQGDAPDKQVFKAIRSYVNASRDTHEAGRNISIQESKSIICVILETADPAIDPDTLSAHQHDIALEHYSTLLSIRDREELTKIVCKSQPDLLTSAIRDLVSAFDPVIRAVHNAVDLSGTVTDAESFITDLIKVSKPKRKEASSNTGSRPSIPPLDTPATIADPAVAASSVPTVEDYVQLLRKHMPSSHKFLHQVAKNAPDLTQEYLEYAKSCIVEFKSHSNNPTAERAGNMTGPLHSLFSSLPESKQSQLKTLLDQHAKHLSYLKSTSHSRFRSLVKSTCQANSKAHAATRHGPGMYLARWHALLDSTVITPATLHGRVRRGWEVKGELDGKGLKTDTVLHYAKKGGGGNKRRNSASGLTMADGTGDERERSERRREGSEEGKMAEVWRGLRDGWVGVCQGLEVMGD
ncbi:hypothetical protein M011DRAFT_481930 [Sporormia fimetaria CBS 119925]|uniref:PX-associated-domain-containing protein n=1 Tax=Sporormia fimetaria CBS 119925 TaxID=1340428 RepID=A0A6A6UX90_9PLEO|nr:hypothetical protein M011DRAFT_481930 [Sporormia fimetaria CBS 119925]